MPFRRLPILPLLVLGWALLASPAGAIDLPSGDMPKVDGVLDEDEWKGATELRWGFGSAWLRVSGDALCIALDMRVPYRGERIELHASDPGGLDYSWHTFHPACAVPEIGSFPSPPVLVRRASWTTMDKANFSAPNSCLFRARVLRKARAWSAEIVVARETLDVAPDRPTVFHLLVSDPTGRTRPYVFTPERAHARGPGVWHPLRANWEQPEQGFVTPEEDARRLFELQLFRELMNRALRREKRESLIEDAVGASKSNEKIDALLARLDGCLKADPSDFFARFIRVRVLRLGNRLDDAVAALDDITRLLPHLVPTDPPLVAERLGLLVALSRFDDVIRLPQPHRLRERWREIAADWRREQELRKRDAGKGDLPRVALDTTRGRIVLELYEEDAPNAVAYLIGLVEAKAFDDRPLEEVRGAFGARLAGAESIPALDEGSGARLPWRGSLGFPTEGKVLGPRLLLTTAHAQFLERLTTVGRVVEGMEHLDALDAGDRIERAMVLRKRNHAYEVRRPEN